MGISKVGGRLFGDGERQFRTSERVGEQIFK